MITAFSVNRIPACSVVEIAGGKLAAREGEEGWQDKGPRCAARSVVCFSYCFVPICDVLMQTAMCAIVIFSIFPVEIAPCGLCGHES